MRKALILCVTMGLAFALAIPALAGKKQMPLPYAGHSNAYVYPPRYQIYIAPDPYGGLVMLDTQTGETYQRVVVNTPKGIRIRWIKVERTGPKEGETILWE